MRIAISTEDKNGLDSVISHHFGRCPFYALVDVEDKKIQAVKVFDNPYYDDHQVGKVPEFIHSHNANLMISGGMGRRAFGFFEQYGIQVVTGASGTVQTTLESYLDGELSGSEPCHKSTSHDHVGHDH